MNTFKDYLKEVDDRDERNAYIFDLDKTLIGLKPGIKNIFDSLWMEAPSDYDFEDSSGAKNDFEISLDEKVLREGRHELEDERYQRTRVAEPGKTYKRFDKENKITATFGPGYLTQELIDMFKNVFGSERFIRPVPQYDAFYTGEYPPSKSSKGNREAWVKYYQSSLALSKEGFLLLHDTLPTLKKAQEVSEDRNNTIFILTARYENEDVKEAIVDLMNRLKVRVGWVSVHMVGKSKLPFSGSATNDAKEKAKVIQDIRDKFKGKVSFYDDKEENIIAARQVDDVEVIKV